MSLRPSTVTLQSWEPRLPDPNKITALQLHTDFYFMMFIPRTACTSVQALQRGPVASWDSGEGLGDFSVLVPCRHFLPDMQALEVTLLKPRFVAFCDLLLSHQSMPFAQWSCPSVPHRSAGYSLPLPECSCCYRSSDWHGWWNSL